MCGRINQEKILFSAVLVFLALGVAPVAASPTVRVNNAVPKDRALAKIVWKESIKYSIATQGNYAIPALLDLELCRYEHKSSQPNIQSESYPLPSTLGSAERRVAIGYVATLSIPRECHAVSKWLADDLLPNARLDNYWSNRQFDYYARVDEILDRATKLFEQDPVGVDPILMRSLGHAAGGLLPDCTVAEIATALPEFWKSANVASARDVAIAKGDWIQYLRLRVTDTINAAPSLVTKVSLSKQVKRLSVDSDSHLVEQPSDKTGKEYERKLSGLRAGFNIAGSMLRLWGEKDLSADVETLGDGTIGILGGIDKLSTAADLFSSLSGVGGIVSGVGKIASLFGHSGTSQSAQIVSAMKQQFEKLSTKIDKLAAFVDQRFNKLDQDLANLTDQLAKNYTLLLQQKQDVSRLAADVSRLHDHLDETERRSNIAFRELSALVVENDGLLARCLTEKQNYTTTILTEAEFRGCVEKMRRWSAGSGVASSITFADPFDGRPMSLEAASQVYKSNPGERAFNYTARFMLSRDPPRMPKTRMPNIITWAVGANLAVDVLVNWPQYANQVSPSLLDLRGIAGEIEVVPRVIDAACSQGAGLRHWLWSLTDTEAQSFRAAIAAEFASFAVRNSLPTTSRFWWLDPDLWTYEDTRVLVRPAIATETTGPAGPLPLSENFRRHVRIEYNAAELLGLGNIRFEYAFGPSVHRNWRRMTLKTFFAPEPSGLAARPKGSYAMQEYSLEFFIPSIHEKTLEDHVRKKWLDYVSSSLYSGSREYGDAAFAATLERGVAEIEQANRRATARFRHAAMQEEIVVDLNRGTSEIGKALARLDGLRGLMRSAMELCLQPKLLHDPDVRAIYSGDRQLPAAEEISNKLRSQLGDTYVETLPKVMSDDLARFGQDMSNILFDPQVPSIIPETLFRLSAAKRELVAPQK